MVFTHPLWHPLWQSRWQLLGGAVMGFLIAAILILVITPKYTVRMIVGPVSANGPAGMGTPAARVNELRRNHYNEVVQADTLSDYDRYLQLLTSPSTAQILIKQVPGILQVFFPERWDAHKKEWHLPPSAWPGEIFRRVRGGGAWHAPTAEDLSARLKKMLQLRMIGQTPMRELELRYADRGFGLTLLYAMHQAADSVLREEAARRSGAISEYLEKQLQSVRMQEHRAVLTELLAAQERIRILVAVDLPYAADIVEPPTAPLEPDVPHPMPLLIFGTLFGFAASAVYASIPRMHKLLARA